jgi:predicted nucleic acid-binding protein
MGARRELVLIDTNVFVMDLRYKRDIHYQSNRKFLEIVEQEGTGFTTTVNLLEVCGILSFNLSKKQLTEFWFYFQQRYHINVLPTAAFEGSFPSIGIQDIFVEIKEKTSLGDALVLALAKKYLPFISTMVTWDKDHFGGKFHGTVLTPAEFSGPVNTLPSRH